MVDFLTVFQSDQWETELLRRPSCEPIFPIVNTQLFHKGSLGTNVPYISNIYSPNIYFQISLSFSLDLYNDLQGMITGAANCRFVIL